MGNWLGKIFQACGSAFDDLFRLFFLLALAYGIFSWVARELMPGDIAVVQFAEIARGSFAYAGILGIILLIKDFWFSLADEADR